MEEHEGVTEPWGGQASQLGTFSCVYRVRETHHNYYLLSRVSADEANLAISLRVYKPPFIRCTEASPAMRPNSKSCETILDTMKASTGRTIFGAVGVADVQEQLPQVLTEREDDSFKHGVLAKKLL